MTHDNTRVTILGDKALPYHYLHTIGGRSMHVTLVSLTVVNSAVPKSASP